MSSLDWADEREKAHRKRKLMQTGRLRRSALDVDGWRARLNMGGEMPARQFYVQL